MALKSDGTVWAWGINADGRLGDGTTTDRATPVQVCDSGASNCTDNPLTGVIAIAIGTNFSLALKSDGTVWAWGNNDNWQLGDGTITARSTPVQVCDVGQTDCATNPLTGVIAIAAGGQHSLALKSNGTVVAWGRNGDGQLGNGTTTGQNTPVQVCDTGQTDCTTNPLTGVIAIAGGGNHSLAAKSNGRVWAWGRNGDGQLGDSTLNERATPTPVCDTGQTDCTANPLTGVIGIAGGLQFSLALKGNGTVWGWGSNTIGQLGDSTNTDRTTPVETCDTGQTNCATNPLTGVIEIAFGDFHSAAMKSDGTVWAWGRNLEGQLGDSTTVSRSSPVQAIDFDGL
jgi:alpha-tubulin suppressor-like RCC1 family protein